MLEVEWTGSYPSLCFGEWVIKYDGIELNMPDYIKKCDMGTYGEYSSWYFDENMSECDESYYDGLDEANWIVKNYDWIKDMFDEKNIHITRELLGELYDKISAEDFRSGSCGGCI